MLPVHWESSGDFAFLRRFRRGSGGFGAGPVDSAASAAYGEPCPEREDKQANNCHNQPELCALADHGSTVPDEDSVTQRCVGEPAEAGALVGPRHDQPHDHSDQPQQRHDDGCRFAGRLRCALFPKFVVFPHAAESSLRAHPPN